MNYFFSDIWSILSSLSIIDYVLYFAVVTLIMLVVSLIYVMNEEKESNNNKEKIEDKPIEPIKGETQEVKDELDLKSIVDMIDENPEPLVDMTAYEEEQEQKAIISYEELLKEARQTKIDYDKEELVDNVIPVKKIILSPVSGNEKIELTPGEPKVEINPEEKEIKLFHYEKEEAFLKALQQLNELLN